MVAYEAVGTCVSINRSLEVKLIIIFYLNRTKMEITQSLGNAGCQKHDKNMQSQASPGHKPQNQVFCVLDTQQQNQDQFVLSSIGLSEIISQDYQIKSNLLVGTKISELARAKLRTWLYEETSRLQVSRHLCGYACTYVDLYLSKQKAIKIEQFQIFGIACLLLANKITDDVEINIDHSIFPKTQIILWQQKICNCLRFRLNPITYQTILGWLIFSWNKFAEKYNLWTYNLYCVESDKLSDATKMFQILDFLALYSKSVSYNKGVLQFQAFKMINRINFERNKQQQSLSIEDEVLISFWSNPEEENLLKSSFQTICYKFDLFTKIIQPWTDKITMEQRRHAQNWIRMVISQQNLLLNRNKKNKTTKIWVQTADEDWYNSMKKLLKSKQPNNPRKGSIETTI